MTARELPRQPNIVIIITDQEREVMHWPDGWAEANLPARNRLVEHGLRFTRAQCNTSACSPSRATLMTGTYPGTHGVKNLVNCDDPSDQMQNHLTVLPSHLPNLATVLGDAGYHVELKGKLRRDPLEMRNLAHAAHITPAAAAQRERLHERLTEVMKEHQTVPDEIRWPSVWEFEPAKALAATGAGD